MARLAQSSEFTIMRTSGMGPWRALRTLLTLGGVFVLLTFLVPIAYMLKRSVEHDGFSASAPALDAWFAENPGFDPANCETVLRSVATCTWNADERVVVLLDDSKQALQAVSPERIIRAPGGAVRLALRAEDAAVRSRAVRVLLEGAGGAE